MKTTIVNPNVFSSYDPVGQAKVFQIAPIVHLVAATWGLNPSLKKDFDVIKKIIRNSVKNN